MREIKKADPDCLSYARAQVAGEEGAACVMAARRIGSRFIGLMEGAILFFYYSHFSDYFSLFIFFCCDTYKV